MSSSREKLLAQFRELVSERLAKVSRFLVTLEGGADAEAGKAALRELHGLKGEARMMGFADVNTVVHQMEDLVRATESLGYALAAGAVDALLVASDAVGVLSGAAPGEPPDVARLVEWMKGAAVAERARAQAAAPSPPPASSPSGSRVTTKAGASGVRVAEPGPAPAPSAPGSGEAPKTGGSGVRAAAPSAPRAKKASSKAATRQDSSIRISHKSLEVLTSTVTSLAQRARRREVGALRRRQLARELVQLHRLAEDLGPVAGELTARLGRAKDFAGDVARVGVVLNTEEIRDLAVLSEEIQSLRMLPLGVLFEPYPRMVRELARDLGKEIELSIEGEDERIDRSVLDALKDPLMHLVRNAVDHGVEGRELRVESGKDPRGALFITAGREGDRLVLAVRDDGAGIDPVVMRRVAVHKGLLDEDAAMGLSDAAAVDLVFLPGFTSKDQVTDVSGRGVGLDVVRTGLLAVGGEVLVRSTVGQGSTFELRVPVSLTVAPLLFVKIADEVVSLPASNVLRALHVEASMTREIAGKPALAVDGEVLPFAAVSSLLGQTPERGPTEGELVLVLRGRGQRAAVAVDRVLDERVQAIFPLKGLLARFPHLSGATTLSDGPLALVLSAPHLVATASGRALKLASSRAARPEKRARRVLVVDDSPLTRELLVSLLESVGYQIIEAVDGGDALDRLAREAVDLIVTDLEMPNVDGLELTRRIKSHSTLRSLPVVIVTTRGSDADRRRGMEAGADGYVTKGDLVRQDLVDVVTRLLA